MKYSPLANYLRASIGSAEFVKELALSSRRRALKQFLASQKTHEIGHEAAPRASFIVPLYNGAAHTLLCLQSILNVCDVPFEVICVDDGCSDETEQLLERFKGVVVHRNAQNLGTLRSVNAGAQLARGDYLILMNSDARFLEGSLAGALRLYEFEPHCGFMGVRIGLVGRGLQEAGALIFQDGATNGYLRHQPVDDPRALYQRDVDYCSSVFAIVSRAHFAQLGGFDEIFAPAYYEETDYCMRTRQANLRCIYNPRLYVDHFEFGSSQKAKAGLQKIKQRRDIFLKRWTPTLAAQDYPEVEATADFDRCAVRLVEQPRQLIVAPNNEAQYCAKSCVASEPGKKTLYILNGNRKMLKQILVQTDMRLAIAFGNQRKLLHFSKQRAGLFQSVRFVGEVDKQLQSDVRLALMV